MKLSFWQLTSISFCINTHKCSRYLAAIIHLFNAHWSGVYAGCLVNDECCLGAAGSLVQSAGRTQLQLPRLGATLSSQGIIHLLAVVSGEITLDRSKQLQNMADVRRLVNPGNYSN